jgi:hypothetical protein
VDYTDACTYILHTYSMEQSSSCETNRFAATQEIPRIFCNPQFHYHIHKYPQPVSLLSQLNSAHTPTSHFLKIHLNIIFPSTPGSPQWPVSLRFPHRNPLHTSPLPHTRYMSRSYHFSRFYHPHNRTPGLTYILHLPRNQSSLRNVTSPSAVTPP